ncbi:alpha/beta fold hydrolase [Streptomyces sp. NPDC048290]|uniref:thioesterase II family protein n=1 Tax=Streptomyces sp. NPDC048290 TaxID=3155811 RepID=UPI00342D57A0
MSDESWTAALRRPAQGAALGRLVVLAHSGAGPNALLPMLRHLPDAYELVGVTLPGRERRLWEGVSDTPPESAAVVNAVLRELRRLPRLPTVHFGHSMGAALAAALALAAPELCKGVVLSAHPGSPRTEWATDWPERDLLDIIWRGGGTPVEILQEPLLREHVFTVLRHDLTLGQRLAEDNVGRKIPVPICVLAGEEDELVDVDQLTRWQTQAAAGYRQRLFPGGHFFLLDDENASAVAAEIAAVLRQQNGEAPSVSEACPLGLGSTETEAVRIRTAASDNTRSGGAPNRGDVV